MVGWGGGGGWRERERERERAKTKPVPATSGELLFFGLKASDIIRHNY